jgi:outer membrane protein, multidrug efflux system
MRCATVKPFSRPASATARALELAQIQYRVGTVDLRAVEQNQLALYAARISRLRVQTERLAQRVNLYLALGGGIEEPAAGAIAAQ